MRPLIVLLLLATAISADAQSDRGSAAKPPDQTASPSQSADAATSGTPAPASPADSTTLEPIKIQKADYPLEAERQQLQGEVVVKLLVSETGDVEAVEVVSGDPILAQSAVAAARKWKFKPFIKGGKPVKASTKVPFDFAFTEKITDKTPPADAMTADTQGNSQPVHISQGVATGLLIHKVQPVYPIAARNNHIQGTVLLAAVIGKDGRIAQLTPVSGPKELIPAATGAVQQWRYKPYLFNGEPAQVQTQITVIFALSPR